MNDYVQRSAVEGEFILEAERRLSQSHLWRLQRNYFERQGVAAWSTGTVPHYVTSNPFLARAYAGVVFGWLRDVASAGLNASQPIYILELGAGSGRLAYHFLTKLFGFYGESVLKDIPITYVMTDFSQSTVDYWQSQPQLQPWVEAGRLDFACFDAERDGSLALIHSGAVLSAGTLKNPLAVIANYVFDGLVQDAFVISEGRLYEDLATLNLPGPVPDPDAPELLDSVRISYSARPAPRDYYDDAALDALLRDYQVSLAQSTLLFPVGALRCLNALGRLANRRLFLLSADKGYHHVSDLAHWCDPELAIHGSFSLMVNYHALGQYILRQGGQFLATLHHAADLDVCGFLLGDHPTGHAETRQAYALAIEQGGPDDFFALRRAVDRHENDFDLLQMLAYWRLSGWDSSIVMDCIPAVLRMLPAVPKALAEELRWAVRQVWETYYYIGEQEDVPFALGSLLEATEYYPEAIEFFEYSLQLHGASVTVLFEVAKCHAALGQPDAAHEYLDLAVASAPNARAAEAMRMELEDRLREEQA